MLTDQKIFDLFYPKTGSDETIYDALKLRDLSSDFPREVVDFVWRIIKDDVTKAS